MNARFLARLGLVVGAAAWLVAAASRSPMAAYIPALMPSVGTTADLAQYPSSYSALVNRVGYYVPGDMPPAAMASSPLPCAAPDGGSQIAAADGGCWNLASFDGVDIRTWGAVNSAAWLTTPVTAAAAAGSANVTLSAASDYQNGQSIAIFGAGAANAAAVPTGLSATNFNNAGGVAYNVQAIGIDANYGFSAPTANLAATYDGTLSTPNQGTPFHAVKIAWTPGAGDVSVAVYVNGVCKFVQAVAGGSFRVDYGQSTECPPWLPAAIPAGFQAGLLLSKINSGAGTTALVLANSAISAVAAGVAYHDSSAQIQAALNGTLNVRIPCGTFQISAGVALNRASYQTFTGDGNCSAIYAAGAGNILSLGSGATPFVGQSAGNFRIDASGAYAGAALYLNGSSAVTIQSMTVTSPYNEFEATNSVVAQVRDFRNNARRRGDVGLYLHGATSNAQAGQFNFSWYNGAPAFQGVGLWCSGYADTLRMLHVATQKAPAPQYLFDNVASGGGATPGCRYPHLTEPGINAAWSPPPNTTTATGAAAVGGGTDVSLAVASTATLNQGGEVTVTGVVGTVEANGTWQFAVLDATHIQLLNVPFVNAYVSGGSVANYLAAATALQGVDVQFIGPYFQGFEPNGTGDGIYVGPGVQMWTLIGGQVFGFGWNGVTDQGFGGVLEGTRVYNNVNASVECGSQAIGADIRGGGDFNYITGTAVDTQLFGVVFDAGCRNASVAGRQWIGTTANILDQASPATDVSIEGLPPFSPPTSVWPVLNSGAAGVSTTLSVAAFPNLYSSSGCAVLDWSAYGAAVTGTTDTAANIIAALAPTGIVGDKFCLVINGHRQFAITLLPGAGVTLTGTPSVPASGAPNAVATRRFLGQVPAAGAVTIKGCSKIAGNQC